MTCWWGILITVFEKNFVQFDKHAWNSAEQLKQKQVWCVRGMTISGEKSGKKTPQLSCHGDEYFLSHG